MRKIKIPTQIALFVLLFLNSNLCAQGGFSQFTLQCKDNVIRPYVLYAPEGIDKTKRQPLLVYLHGGVSRTTIIKHPIKYAKKSKLIGLADEGHFYLLFCFGQKKATWFDEVGVDMVLKEIDEVENNYAIDSNRIFLSAFSDGGSGALYFSMTTPFSFAGFISLNGNLSVSSEVGLYDLYPANMNHKPIYIINTKKDLLYPINQISQSIEYLKKYNENIRYKEVEGGHDLNYLTEEKQHLIEFIKKGQSQEVDSFEWETSNVLMNSLKPLEIMELDTTSPLEAWHHPYQLDVLNDKADFGLKYDFSYREGGLKVKSFQHDTCTARRIGIEKNDIILAMENDTMISPYSSYSYTAGKRAGDKTRVRLLRNTERIELEGTFNKGYFVKIFDPTLKSGKIVVKWKDNQLFVHTSRIAKFSINFDAFTRSVDELIVNNELYELNLSGRQIVEIK